MTKATMFDHDWFSNPATSLLGIAARKDLSFDQLANAVGGVDVLRGLLRGTESIDEAVARSLAEEIGGSANFWLTRQRNYDRALNQALNSVSADAEEWLKEIPAPGKKARGRLSEEQRSNELRRRLAFYGVHNLNLWKARYGRLRKEAQFRTSQSFTSEDGAVSLWLRQGELEAALIKTKKWDPEKLRERLKAMLRLSLIRQPARFIPKLQQLGAEAGVSIVVVRATADCKASGASRMISADKAMILLSFRHLSDDHFWFTFLHECAHLLLHSAESFVDEDEMVLDEREVEANEFASSCIVPPARWKEFEELRLTREAILRFAVSLKIAPGLIVGQLQHRGAPKDRFNFLKRRWTWQEVEAAIATR